MFNKLYRLMQMARIIMLLSVPLFSMFSYMFYKFTKQVSDLKLLSLFESLQYYSFLILKIIVAVIILYYIIRVIIFLINYKKNKIYAKVTRRIHLLKQVFEGMKIPEEKYPKFDYEMQDDVLILTIYKNFYIEVKMITDNITKFEQVFNLKATKIDEVGFDKICIYFMIEATTLYIEDFDMQLESNELCVGKTIFENIVINLNFTPHLLIAGSNGSGKTSFMRFLYYQFKQKQDKGIVKIILFDGKGIEFSDYRDECIVVYKNFLDELEEIHLKMKRRYNDMRTNGQRIISESDERIILIIDEYTSILDNMKKEDRIKFEKIAGDIARLGRSAGYNVIIGLQRADAKFVQGEIKENMTKVLLGSASDEAKRIMFGRTDVINQERGAGNIQIDDRLFVFKFPFVE